MILFKEPMQLNQSIFVYLMTRHRNWHKCNCDLHCRPRMFKG